MIPIIRHLSTRAPQHRLCVTLLVRERLTQRTHCVYLRINPSLLVSGEESTYLNYMLTRNANTPRRNIQATRARQAKQKIEGVVARVEYEANEKATLERTARLRAERLARQSKPNV